MNKDIIYRQDATNALKEVIKNVSNNYTELNPMVMAGCGFIEDCIHELESLPSAQPERNMIEYAKMNYVTGFNEGYEQGKKDAKPKQKKGKWKTVSGRLGNEVECNQCHEVFWYWMANYRFCPSCGADMRGEQDE